MLKTSCAIMFADVSGSTQMYDRLGDEAAKKNIDRCLDRLQVVVEAHHGVVVKKIGDELMCRFDTADAAVSAAIVSQSEIKSLGGTEQAPLSIRIGIHYGEVIEDENDIFGDAVNVAARMAGIARGGQIITTADAMAGLDAELATRARQVDLTRVKGKQEKLALFEVLWEQGGDVTRVATELLSRGVARPSKLRLSRGEMAWEIENESASISIGRGEGCDIVIDTALASRTHAYCELRRGKFVLVDQGTNGTYVGIDGEDEVYLRREEMVLRGSGSISLGKPVAEAAAGNLIRFEC